MNPWRQHPAIAGLPIPDRYLPPARSWPVAMSLGFIYPDGARVPMAANPEGLHKGWKWAGGPVPAPVKKGGKVKPPADATVAVYKWLIAQATMRLGDVKAHIRSRGRSPSIDDLAHKYTVKPGTVRSWVEKVKEIGVNKAQVPQPEPFDPREVKIPKGVTYFLSGTQGSPGEVEGAARLAKRYPNLGVGIDVSACREDCMLALRQINKKKVKLFVDSGAFGEFQDNKPISPDEWDDRLADYEHISRLFKDRAYLVAPDKIGDQAETAQRLIWHAGLLRKPARDYKSWILLVAQAQIGEGGLPRHEFWENMRHLLVQMGIPKNKIVAALPLQEEAATDQEVKAFARSLGKSVDRYHLLGLGPLRKRLDRIVKIILASNPKARITCDSNLIAGGAVRGFLSVKPRVYTYAQDIVRFEVMSEAFQRSWRGGEAMEGWVWRKGWGIKAVPEYHENVNEEVNSWVPRQYRRVLADYLRQHYKGWGPDFGAREHDLLMNNPKAWLQLPMHRDEPGGPKWYEDPEVEAWLDDQWTRFLGSYFSARVKRDAMCKSWRVSLSKMRELVPDVDEKINLVAFGGSY